MHYHLGLADDRPDLSKVPTPPQFVHSPNPSVLWFVVHNAPVSANNNGADNSEFLKERKFNCKATGVPDPEYV